MNEQHNDHTRQSAPGPFCATYEPFLALQHLGELDPAEQVSLRQHLTTCAWCREHLGEYATVYSGLLKHFGHEISAPPALFTLDDIIHAAEEEDDEETEEEQTEGDIVRSKLNTGARLAWPTAYRRQRRASGPLSGLAAVAAALLVALLTAMLLRLHVAPPSMSVLRVPGVGTLEAFLLPAADRQPRRIVAGPDGAVWFTENGHLGRITPAGQITEYPLPSGATPSGLAVGPDGNLWFTVVDTQAAGWIGRLNPRGGAVTEFALPDGGAPTGPIATGPDGHVWFIAAVPGGQTGAIGNITPSGHITTFSLKIPQPPTDLAAGPDGNLWFTGLQSGQGAIGSISPSGVVTWFPLPHPLLSEPNFTVPNLLRSAPSLITAGPDGNLWFTVGSGATWFIGRITPKGVASEFALGNDQPTGLTAGPDGNLWFVSDAAISGGDHQIGRVSPLGVVAWFAVPSGVSLDDIALGSDGSLWGTDTARDTILRITPAR